MDNQVKQSENVLFGIVGAFLFSLAGGALYYVLYQVGYLAAVSGLVAVICAMKGYEFFSKGMGTRGVVISTVVAAFVLVLSWYCCLATDVYNAYQEWFAAGEVDFTPTYFQCLRYGYEFLADVPEYFADLGISLLLAAIGCGSYFVRTNKNKKAIKAQQEEPAQQNIEE